VPLSSEHVVFLQMPTCAQKALRCMMGTEFFVQDYIRTWRFLLILSARAYYCLLLLFYKPLFMGWKCSSVLELLPGMHRPVGMYDPQHLRERKAK
jgi:hypothetical protein